MAPVSTENIASNWWLKITINCPTVLLEAAADLMGVLSGSAVEQSPEADGTSLVSGFFPLETNGDPATASPLIDERLDLVWRSMTELFSLYGLRPDHPSFELLADEDWATSWQQYFKPIEVVPRLVIKPSWEEYTPLPGQHVIEMDPGMAFGTGQHASTRLALSLISRCCEKETLARAVDVGTGTGILAMAAALFGVTQVVAVDNDPEAVTVAAENVGNNDLTSRITVSATPADQLEGTFELVCANIVHDVLVALAPTLTRLTTTGGSLILAGILSGIQEESIIHVYHSFGLRILDRAADEEWVALLFRQPAG